MLATRKESCVGKAEWWRRGLKCVRVVKSFPVNKDGHLQGATWASFARDGCDSENKEINMKGIME